MPNRLADALSPYLRQHAENPVDWWPWCDEAFAEARRRDVPVLLSVGYASCHWCHVMAHESFEDAEVAAVMNANFVNVKLDREERPDVDSVYMTATQALTGRGGWPMTVVLTPDGSPFYAGTYFPKAQFMQLLGQLTTAWREQRAEVDASAERIVSALRDLEGAGRASLVDLTPGSDSSSAADVASGAGPLAGAAGEPLSERLAQAEEVVADEVDWTHGGFGSSPKFPPTMVLHWLLRHHARTGTPRALQVVETTCEAMARGGVYDQLAGGFARYSVDEAWVVPHFEKMLYDNAQLLDLYAAWHEATGSPLAARVASDTADFLIRELGTEQGAFASSLDADTVLPGGTSVEGFTYIWTPAALNAVLGDDDGARAARLLSVTDRGTFEHGASTLQLRDEPAPGEQAEWWAATRARLLDARGLRPQPARDDKVVASWNGLAIGALVRAARTLARPDLLDRAVAAADFVVSLHLDDAPEGRLRRVSLDGRIGDASAVSDDLGNLAACLVLLHEATGEPRWLEAAGRLLDDALDHYGDGEGGFNDVADNAPPLFMTPQTTGDNAEPCGQSSLAGALWQYARVTGSSRHRDAAVQALAAGMDLAETQPRFAGHYLAVAEQVAAE
ncbi:MAG: thioredoxin domain-containing protein [Dermatophilus congolensis]|nr:thioredoxin domain-containing protein [Dermatophilus congolensis]